MMKLYYAADCPYCAAVIKALDTYGVDVELLPRSTHEDEIVKLTGSRSVPVLVDGETVLTETSAILAHLSAKYGEKQIPGNDYGIRTRFAGTVEEAEAAITEALKEVGFGVLTRIDVAATLKKKLDLDRPPYVILGACNPKIASKALEMEPELGLLLPCNVIVYENEKSETIVAAVAPVKMLQIVGRPEMLPLAEQVRDLLRQAIARVANTTPAKEEA